MQKENYTLCDRTVTVYRRQADGTVLRAPVDGCFYSWQTRVSPMRCGRKFLLVIPGETQRVFPGDRIFDGIGPKAEDVVWDRFVPALVEGLSQVQWVQPWHYGGRICHFEAGSNG